MEPSLDLRAGLAPLFLDEPRGRSVQEQVHAGKRRLRRRRAGVAVAVLVAVAAVGVGYTVTAGGTTRSEGPVAPPTTAVDVPPRLPLELRLLRSMVRGDRFGHANVRPGVEVVRREDNFLGLVAPYSADAVEVRKGKAHFVVATLPEGAFQWERAGKESLDELIAQVTSAPILSYRETGPMPLNIWEWGDDGLPPVLDPGIKVLRTIENPFHVDPPRRSLALVIRGGAHTWWAYWELGPSGRQGAVESRRAGDAYPSIEAWLADQRVRTRW